MGHGVQDDQVVLFRVLIVLGTVVLVTWIAAGTYGAPAQFRGRTPLDIFNERYAKGEIQREEYEQKERGLAGQKSPREP